MPLPLLLILVIPSPVLVSGVATPPRGQRDAAPIGTGKRNQRDAAPIPAGVAPTALYNVGTRGVTANVQNPLQPTSMKQEDAAPITAFKRGQRDAPGPNNPPAPVPAFRAPLLFTVQPTPATPQRSAPPSYGAVAGTPPVYGAAVQSVGALVQAATGTALEAATVVQYVGALRQAATGTELAVATAAQRVGRFRQAATGVDVVTGTGAQRLRSLSQAATGEVLQPTFRGGTGGETTAVVSPLTAVQAAVQAAHFASLPQQALPVFLVSRKDVRAEVLGFEFGEVRFSNRLHQDAQGSHSPKSIATLGFEFGQVVQKNTWLPDPELLEARVSTALRAPVVLAPATELAEVTSEGSIYAEPREVPLEHAAPPENEQIAAIRVLEETLSVAPRVDRDAAWRTAARAEFLNERASWRREGRKRAA